MTYNPQQYETVYGFSLLDELHNFMPEALYDDTMFETRPNEMLAYFRHRMTRLFQPTFVRQQHIYNIYMAQARRAEFAEWRRSRTTTLPGAPPAVPFVPPSIISPISPDLLTAIHEALNGTATNNVPETPPAQIRRPRTAPPPRAADIGAGNLIGVNTVGQSLRAATASAPGAEPTTTTTNSPPPPRRHRVNNNFVTANELLNFNATRDSEAFLNFIAGTMLREFDVPITGTGVAAGRFWEEVDVVATPEQIAAGSTVLEQSAIANDVNCAICQEHTYAEGASAHQWRQLRCSHQFHIECVDSWLDQSVHCPVCRADIRGETAEEGEDTSYAAAARRGAHNN